MTNNTQHLIRVTLKHYDHNQVFSFNTPLSTSKLASSLPLHMELH